MILIVGSGLFGSVARDLLTARGIPCKVIDDGRPMSGSYPAGCLTKPSWLDALGKAREPALGLLDQLYGIQKLPLRLGPARLDSIMHVPPAAILRAPDVRARVTGILPEAGVVHLDSGETLVGHSILVAAGVWCRELLPLHFGSARLEGLQGVSLRFRETLPEARLKLWAPFKQSVAFNIEPGVAWFGDGTSLRPESWTPEHDERAQTHAADLGLDPSNLIEVRHGLRPYVRGHTGWFQRAGRRCWVSTGGAKNGVVLAAAQALQFLNAVE